MAGKKFDSEKEPISLIPVEAIKEEAKALAYGANKYGVFNFREGIEYRRLIDAALRHIFAVADGEDIDKESGCYHAACARANLGMLLYMMKNKPEMDNRYKPKVEEAKQEYTSALELFEQNMKKYLDEDSQVKEERITTGYPDRDKTTGVTVGNKVTSFVGTQKDIIFAGSKK